MKPVIGVIPLFDEEKDSIWMVPGYMEGIRSAGGLPVILPLKADEETIAQACGLCDGFLFTGGLPGEVPGGRFVRSGKGTSLRSGEP